MPQRSSVSPPPAAGSSTRRDDSELWERTAGQVDTSGAASTSAAAAAAPTGRSVHRPRRAVPPSTGAVTAQVLADHVSMFSSLLYEYEYWVDPRWIDGEIPAELVGTYLRNGPGLQVNNGKVQRHMFDGDGMVLSLAMQDGRAFFQNKFVRTQGFEAEQAAGKMLLRNSFTRGAPDGGALWNPLDLRFKNVANTGILHWAGRLFALWEVGMPHELVPTTLETRGEGWLSGHLAAQRLAAHYRTTQEADGSKRLVTFGSDVALTGTVCTFYEHDEAGRQLHATSVPLVGVDVCFVHDMAVTEHYYVLVIGPMRFDVGRFATQYLTGRCSVAECLKYDEALPTKIMMFPRPGRPDGAVLPARTLETQPFFAFHHVNAYELDGGRQVVIDTVALDEVALDVTQYNATVDHFVGGARSEYYRLVCDLPAQGSGGTVTARQLFTRTCEFPTMNPAFTGKQNRFAYLAADTVDDAVLWGPTQCIVKVCLPEGGSDTPDAELDVWYPGPRQAVGEPMFVARPNGTAEDDGWLIVTVHDAAAMKGDVHILDAQRLSDGPVCTLHLPHHLSAGLHGTFTPTYLGPDPDDLGRPKWKQPNKIKQL